MTNPRPIPIRLPEPVERALRQAADARDQTLNSVVIESLRESLPPAPEQGSSIATQLQATNPSRELVLSAVLEYLSNYEVSVLTEQRLTIEMALELTDRLCVTRYIRETLNEGAPAYIKESIAQKLRKRLVRQQFQSAQIWAEFEALLALLKEIDSAT